MEKENLLAVILADTTQECLDKAIEEARKIAEFTDKTVRVQTYDEDWCTVTLGKMSFIEYDHEGNLLAWCPEECLNQYIQKSPGDEYLDGLKRQAEKLQKEIDEINSRRPAFVMFSHHAEDCDDEYQEALEDMWELHDLKEELENVQNAINECR